MREISEAEIVAVATFGPIWLRTSQGNRRAAEVLWSDPGLSIDRVTTFDPPPGCSAEEASLYILDTVIEHHPAWTSMEFIGARLPPVLARELASCAEGFLHATERGFVLSRRSIET